MGADPSEAAARSPATLVANQVSSIPEREEVLRHPDKVWTDRTYAEEPLDRLVKEYAEYLRGRAQRVSAATVQNYRAGLLSFYRSLERNHEPTVLGSVTPHAVDRWVTERRAEGRAEEGIASALRALKVVTRKFVWQHLDLTTVDLLAKVPRVAPPEHPMPSLSEEEIERILDCFDRATSRTRATARSSRSSSRPGSVSARSSRR